MQIDRIIRLAFVALLAAGLSAGVVLGNAHFPTGSGQATLSVTSGSGDCSLCEDCATPCVVSTICSAAGISGLAPNVPGPALRGHGLKMIPYPGWQLSSAELGIPTPPPRFRSA